MSLAFRFSPRWQGIRRRLLRDVTTAATWEAMIQWEHALLAGWLIVSLVAALMLGGDGS